MPSRPSWSAQARVPRSPSTWPYVARSSCVESSRTSSPGGSLAIFLLRRRSLLSGRSERSHFSAARRTPPRRSYDRPTATATETARGTPFPRSGGRSPEETPGRRWRTSSTRSAVTRPQPTSRASKRRCSARTAHEARRAWCAWSRCSPKRSLRRRSSKSKGPATPPPSTQPTTSSARSRTESPHWSKQGPHEVPAAPADVRDRRRLLDRDRNWSAGVQGGRQSAPHPKDAHPRDARGQRGLHDPEEAREHSRHHGDRAQRHERRDRLDGASGTITRALLDRR